MFVFGGVKHLTKWVFPKNNGTPKSSILIGFFIHFGWFSTYFWKHPNEDQIFPVTGSGHRKSRARIFGANPSLGSSISNAQEVFWLPWDYPICCSTWEDDAYVCMYIIYICIRNEYNRWIIPYKHPLKPPMFDSLCRRSWDAPCKAMGNLKSDTLLFPFFLNSDRRQESQEFQTKNSIAIPHDPQNPESWKSEGKSQMLDGLKS